MTSEDASAFWALHRFAHVAESTCERREVVRHGRGQEGGHACLCLEALHLPDGLRVIVHRVGTDAAVDVDVEEARRDIGSARVDACLEPLALGRCDSGSGADGLYLLVEEEREPFLDFKTSRLVGDDESAVDDCFHGFFS